MRFLMYDPLEPQTEVFTGGRIVDGDLLPLEVAAKMATKHAGEEITTLDFVLAAARDEISLLAYLPRTCKMIHCDSGKETDAPQGAIVELPAASCRALGLWGETRWRAIEHRHRPDKEDGEVGWYAKNTFVLADGEESLVTTIDRIAVKGREIHALADAFKDHAQPNNRQPLTEEEMGEIHRLLSTKEMAQKDIAKKFDVTPARISQIKKLLDEKESKAKRGAGFSANRPWG